MQGALDRRDLVRSTARRESSRLVKQKVIF